MFLDTIRRGLIVRGRAHQPREVHVRVPAGYLPDTIRAEAGVLLRVVFRREESSACSEMVVFDSLGKSAAPPEGQPTAVELRPTEAGEYPFSCQMGMLRGRLVIEEAA